ncbi:MAG TPA: hypothetical protein VHD83_03820 [Puia sp.]|nr:hypothetical protein [Puia sp.]
MYLEHKYLGDDGSTADELMTNVTEVEEKGNVIDMAVRGGYLTLSEALSSYGLTEIEYVAYSLLKNKGRLGAEEKEKQVIEALFLLVEAYAAPSASFQGPGRQVMEELKTIVNDSPLTDKDLEFAW